MKDWAPVTIGPTEDWKEVLKLEPGSTLRIDATSSENHQIAIWTLYLDKASEGQNARMKDVLIPTDWHRHSSAIEWEMLGNGTLRVRKKAVDGNDPLTTRVIKLTHIDVLRGQPPVVFTPSFPTK